MPITRFQKSFQHLILLLLLARLALVGTSTWRHTQETDQPPVHDAFTYYLKAHNFWANLSSAKGVNPLNLEPTFRPPGTVLMAYPFGFDPDYRNFYFRSIFLPIALLVAGVVVAGYGRDLSNRSKWYLALIAAFLTTLPAFYDFEVAPGFAVPSHWGLVDNFLGGMAALAAGASVRSVARQSTG